MSKVVGPSPHSPLYPLNIPWSLARPRSPLPTWWVRVHGDPLHDANFFQHTSRSLEPYRDLGRPHISPILGPPQVPRLVLLGKAKGSSTMGCASSVLVTGAGKHLGDPRDCTRRTVTRLLLLITAFYGSYPGKGESVHPPTALRRGEGGAKRKKMSFGRARARLCQALLPSQWVSRRHRTLGEPIYLPLTPC